MGKDKLTEENGKWKISLAAENETSLSSGSLRLYAQLSTFHSPLSTPIVGCVDLYNYDPLNKRAAIGIMVSKDYRRQGYALAMLHALQELSATHYQLHTLYADIAATNTASVALFRKAGYEECGRFKEWLEYDSHFIDNIRMQKIL